MIPFRTQVASCATRRGRCFWSTNWLFEDFGRRYTHYLDAVVSRHPGQAERRRLFVDDIKIVVCGVAVFNERPLRTEVNKGIIEILA